MRLSAITAWICVSLASPIAWSLELHVAPNGNDDWSGKLTQPNASHTDGPFATLNGARLAIRKLPRPLQEPIQVTLAAGTYRLTEEIRFTGADSGEAKALITYQAATGAEVILDGGQPLPAFTVAANGHWTTKAPLTNGRAQQLWVGGKRAPRAKSFNEGYHFVRQLEEETPVGPDLFRQKVRLAPADIALLQKASAAEVADTVINFYHKWDNTRRRIESVDVAEGSITVVGGPTKPWNTLDHHTGFVLENLPAFLDAPGEWFLDRAGQLTYHPRAGEKPGQTIAVIPMTTKFLSFVGEPQRPVSHLRFQGLKFRHAKGVENTDLFNPNQAAVSTVDGVVTLDHAQSVTFFDCEFAHFGSYGVSLRKGCNQVRVERCLITDMGAGAVRIGNLAEAANPADLVSHNTIHNCILRDGGHIYPCAVGIWIGFASDNVVTHNEVSDLFYSAISVGWRWGYAPSSAKRNRIEYNHLHHLGKGVLSDMGGVYTLGPSEGTSISHNHIHHVRCFSYGGWGLYNDEGSTGITMEGNVCHDTTDGGYHQHYGKDNVVRNNIFAFADLYQFKRSRAEEHRSFTFAQNLVVFERGDTLGGVWTGTTANYLLQGNLYWDYSGRPVTFTAKKLTLADWQKTGQDVGSIIADPLFANPTKRDFSLRSDSPALALGFKPIDTSVMGVTGDEAWKTLARTFVRPAETARPEQPAPPAIAFRASFEGVLRNPKAPTAFTRGAISGKGDSLSFSKEHSSNGLQSLKFTDAANLPAHYFPMLTVSPNHASGVTTCNFDVWLEPKAYFVHEWRDQASPYHAGPTFTLKDGKLVGPTGPLMDIPSNQWVHYEVTATIGAAATGTWTLKVTPTGGATKAFTDLPFRSKELRTVNWIGFISNANEPSAFFLDQLTLTTTDPNR